MGHSTWDSFSQATKVFKHVSTALSSVGRTPAQQRVSFSSFPGELFSDDDLYLLGSGLVVLSTTNHIANASLFDHLPPTTVLAYQRVRVANLLARSGSEWAALFARHNSGTYNNQARHGGWRDGTGMVGGGGGGGGGRSEAGSRGGCMLCALAPFPTPHPKPFQTRSEG